jgi:outer membrane protein assembly factor BamB
MISMKQHRTLGIAMAALLTQSFSGAQAQQPGEILWTVEGARGVETPWRPTVDAQGVLFWDSGSDIHRILPNGQIDWVKAGLGDGRPIAVDAQGNLYVGDDFATIHKLASNGSIVWTAQEQTGQSQGLIGGPSIGPDGNVYGVADAGMGAFSLTPNGALRWNTPGFSIRAGAPSSEIIFTDGKMIKAEDTNPDYWGLAALDMQNGNLVWNVRGNVHTGASRYPRINPVTGYIQQAWSTNDHGMQAFDSNGDQIWRAELPWAPIGVNGFTVGPDGVVYVVHGEIDVMAISKTGQMLWFKDNILPRTGYTPAVSPDGQTLIVPVRPEYGAYEAGRVFAFNTADGTIAWNTLLGPAVEGQTRTPVDVAPVFSPDGSTVYVTGATWDLSRSHIYALAVASQTSVETTATLTGISVPVGSRISGTLNNLKSSDDRRYVARSEPVFSGSAQHVVELRVTATTTDLDAQRLNVSVEGRLTEPGGTGRIRVRNWTTNKWHQVHQYPIGLSESVATVGDVPPAGLIRQSDGRIQLSIRYSMLATFGLDHFDAQIDHVRVTTE